MVVGVVGCVGFGFGCVVVVLAMEWWWRGCDCFWCWQWSGGGVVVAVFGCVVAGGGGCGRLKGLCGGNVLFYFNECFILF